MIVHIVWLDNDLMCLLFSGCPTEDDRQECRNPFNVFQGCMRLLTVDNQNVDLIMVQQKQLGVYSNLQIDMCGIIDRFVLRHLLRYISVALLWLLMQQFPNIHRGSSHQHLNDLLIFDLCICLLDVDYAESPTWTEHWTTLFPSLKLIYQQWDLNPQGFVSIH